MKTVFDIFARDLRALVRNPVAFLVVLALLVLPGLYAWYCILANWDPYANTGSMPIAVVNKDKGTTSSLTGDVNIGQQVTDKLHDNDSIDWRFYDDEEEALRATRDLECYATIMFPEDLSENVVGIFEGSEDPPAIYYYPNEKQNAVATKVCDSATQTLVRGVNQEFASLVNETILRKVQDATNQAEDKIDHMNASAMDEIRSTQQDIQSVIQSLDEAVSSIDNWRSAVAGSQEALDGTAQQLPVIRSALDSGSNDLNELRVKTSDFESRLTTVILDSCNLISSLSARSATNLAKAAAEVEQTTGSLNAAIGSIEALLASATLLPEDVVVRLTEQLESLRSMNDKIDASVQEASQSITDLNGKVQQRTQDVEAASNTFATQIMPQLSTGVYDLSVAMAGLSGALGQFEPQIGELQNVLTQTDSALARAIDAIAEAKTLLTKVGDDLNTTVTDLGGIGNALQIDKVSELLDIDPDRLGQFVSSPVEMVTEKIYPVSNYGTAVAPFYTNLALWVGCFILISLIKVEVDSRGFEAATTRQRYFGRWLLFVVLALLQSQVICGVDILLGIDCANPAAFMAAGAVCSFAYMNLIFALVSTFRNVGKTLCILLLIMQVPGSSGMYPIQIMPGFFQMIHPALPFTYGIDAMREALSGMYGARYITDLGTITLIVPLSLVLGLLLRPFMMNLLMMFDDEMRKTGFFASEEHGQHSAERVRNMMRALMSHDSYRDDFEERAWSFNRRYPLLRRMGSIATFAIPFAFLLIMLPLNVFARISTDVKLNALMAMLIVLLIVLFALIVLEYMHRTIAEETRLLGAQIIGDDWDYQTLFDQAEDTRQAVSAELDHVRDRAADDLLRDVPPLSSDILAMIPATSKISADNTAVRAQDGTPAPRKRLLGVARDIFLTDMRLGFQSVIGVVVIMLLVITPSLYAWFNIAASWDPYSNTGNLKVAVANSDEGYKGELIPVTVNIGDTIVSQLRGNSNFNWEFVTEEEATRGVNSGECYAAIVIPDDFSRNMMTYLTSDTDYPTVLYYTNEKENPIAPIITQKGATSIQESIRATFAERVDEVGLTMAYDLLEYVTNPRVSNYVQKMSGHLDDATHDMGLGSSELRTLSNLSVMTAGVIETAGVAFDGIISAGNTARTALVTADVGAESASAAFDQAAATIEGLLSSSEFNVDEIVEIIDSALALLEAGAQYTPDLLWKAQARVNEVADTLEAILPPPTDPDYPVLKGLVDSLRRLADGIGGAAEQAETVPSSIEATRAELWQLAADAKAGLADVKAYYQDNVKSSIDELKSKYAVVKDSTDVIMSGLDDTVAGLAGSTGSLSSQMNTLSADMLKAGDKLDAAAQNIEDVKARVAQALQSGDVKQLESVLLGSDTTQLAERLSAPIEEVRQPMYPVSNFGSSMASFYTVLSLWVGALVMVSTMRVHVVEERVEELRNRFVRVRLRHEFLGRYGIFGFISLLQSLLVSLGDLMFLHIQCVHPVAYVLFAVFIGQVFCMFVYTVSELFGDIGKALCVILLIMQVAASGGTFPVAMLHPMLRSIVPFLPFFHGMTLLQECVAGVSVGTAAISIGALVILVIIVLVLGMPLRRPFRKLTDWFELQLEKTGFM